MSDTSAIDQGDDADTKTTPDQPGQPNIQTWRPPPWLPTPIGALASQLGQAMQSRPVGPLPQPAPLPPFDQAQQRAQQRVAPYARPTGAFPPYQKSPVQTYVPARPTRDPHEWGTSEPYANTPATWELPGMWQGIGQRLSQIGSGATAGLGGLLMMFSKDSMKNYVAGQSARIKLDHERTVDAAWDTDRQLDEELRSARDAYALFGGDVASMTGADKDISLKGVGKFVDAQRAIAAKYNDYYLQAAIDSGDMKRVENIWKERDATSRDLKASLTQQRKDEAAREELAPYLKDGGRTQAGPMRGAVEPESEPSVDTTVPEDTGEPGSPATAPTPVQPGDPTVDPFGDGQPADQPQPDAQAQAQQPRPVQVAQAGASDAPQPGMQRLAQARPDTAGWQPTPSAVLQQAGQDTATPYGALQPGPVDDLAQKAVNDPMFKPGVKGYPGVPPQMQGYVERRRQEIENDLRRIEEDPRFDGSTPAKRHAAYNAIKAVDPGLALTVLNSVEGKTPMPTSARYQTLRDHVARLGGKIDPTFNYQTYASRAKTMSDFTSGQEGRTLTAIGTAYRHINHALEALNHMPNWLQGQISGSRLLGGGFLPKSVQDAAGNLNNYLNTANSEYERALVGGKPTQTARGEQEKETDWRTVPVEVIRADLLSKRDALRDRMQTLKQQWAGGTGREPGGMLSTFDAFSHGGQGKGWGEGEPAPSPDDAGALRELDRTGGAQAAPAPAQPGWKFEPVQ